jgi:hypothetical protein
MRKEEPPPMDRRDSDFVLNVLRMLLHHGELQSDLQKLGKKRNAAHLSVYIRPDITRTAAVSTVQSIFEKWLPDGGEDYIIKVRAMPQSELGIKYVVSFSITKSCYIFRLKYVYYSN